MLSCRKVVLHHLRSTIPRPRQPHKCITTVLIHFVHPGSLDVMSILIGLMKYLQTADLLERHIANSSKQVKKAIGGVITSMTMN